MMDSVCIDLSIEQIKLLSYTIGFAYSIFVGLLIGLTQKYIYFNDDPPEWRSCITGMVERVLYTGAMLSKNLAFVSVWIAMKSVAHWDRFSSDKKPKEGIIDPELKNKRLTATAIFNGYFIGTGLSLVYGVAGGYIATKIIECQILSAVAVAVGPVVLNLLIIFYLVFKVLDEIKKKKPSLYLKLKE